MSTPSTATAPADAGPDPSPYQYQPLALSSGEIRLIKIRSAQEPPQTSPDASILLDISLFQAPIDQAGPYLAVSYAWGDPTATHKVLVNGAPVWIPSNTFRVLYTIYCSVQTTDTELYRAGEDVALWIDALCINQLDIAEKNIQVPRMGQIYRQAKGGIGYIGAAPEGQRPEDGFRSLRWFAHVPMIKPPEGMPEDESDPRFQAWVREKMAQEQERSERPNMIMYALNGLFANDWFARCWVIQEMVLSRVTVCLYGYGQDSKTQSLSTMAMLFDRSQKFEETGGRAAYWEESELVNARHAISWRVLRWALVKKPGGLGIVDLLSRTRESKATDLRDKVYALLGLMDAKQVPALRVDYSDGYPAARLFHDVAVHCMASAEGQMTLVHAGLERSIPGLPTWVPDWSARYRIPLKTDIYNACANCFHPINVLPGGRKISALGITVDAIAVTGIPVSYPRDTVSPVFELVVSAAIICGQLRERYRAGYVLRHENWPDVMWRTCCVDCSWEGRLTTADRASFQACLKRFGFGDDVFADVKVDETGRMPVENASWMLEDTAALWEAARGFELMVSHYQTGRVLGTTAGGLFGSFPSTAKAGDVVVVLSGGRVPFVLRPVGEDVFELVGAAYVHGIMDGEWVRAALARKDMKPFRDFVVQ